MSYAIKLDNISKNVKKKSVLNNLCLQVEKGEIYGVLGTNGSGKTSMIRLILNLWHPSNGNIEILGEKVVASSFLYREKLGVVWEIPYFQEQLTGRQNLELHCAYMNLSKTDNVHRTLECLDMKAVADIPVKEYSEGLKRRLDIARAIVTKPELLLLDEPFQQIDLKNREEIGMLLKTFRERLGTSVFVTSSSADDLDGLVDRIGFIERGTISKELSATEYSEWLEEQKKAVW